MISRIVKDLIETNQRYIREDRSKGYQPAVDHQTPEITLVTCADSRLSTAAFKQNTINHVFAIRNIGNQMRTAEGSVDYGVLHLHTPILVFLGHTNCGAVNKSMGNFSGETLGICRELSLLREGLDTMRRTYHPDDPIRFERYAELNVDFQVRYAVEKYRDMVHSGQLTVIGMMMDMHRCFEGATYEEYITNINGTNDIEEMKKMRVLSEINPNILDEVVKTII